jgi:hypothetical protein
VPGEAPRPPSLKLTHDGFVLFPDDGKRHELIDGEHYVTPSPNPKHQAIVFNLTRPPWSYWNEHPVGRAFVAPFNLRAGVSRTPTAGSTR